MGLVDDDEVEVTDAKPALTIKGFVDEPHHRGIRRYEDPALRVFVGDEVHGR